MLMMMEQTTLMQQRGSVLSYMNLSSLLVARDSLRQSAADLLGLRLGLNFINDTTINSKDVTYIGHSLGSIVAPAFIAQANTPMAETLDPLFNVNTVALASGGGGIASFLLESAAFGPFIQGSVLSQAGTTEADELYCLLTGRCSFLTVVHWHRRYGSLFNVWLQRIYCITYHCG